MNSTYYHQNHPHTPRKTHRKRLSLSRLSSSTVQTLPEYSSPHGWNKPVSSTLLEAEESDRPPDYPETADEADADTEEGDVVYVQQHPVHPPPRRTPSHIRRRKRTPVPPADPFLDTLLERSVHALEMSNALLQSSMSTHSSLSALLSPEGDSDRFLEVRARNLSTRIRVNSGVHETWMDHLDEISKGVDTLLPTSSGLGLRHRRRPSLLDLNVSPSSSSHLQYSHPTRDVLVAPPPRALTQYVESTVDPQLIILPSTLGLRTPGSSHSADARGHSFTHRQEAQPAQSAGYISESQSDSTTPAYHLLSNLVKRSESPPPSVRLFGSCTRRGSASTTSTERSTKTSLSPSSVRTMHASPDRTRSRNQSSGSRSRSSLRKILDKNPSSVSVDVSRRKDPKLLRAPSFLPVTPPPAPLQGTSTATASVSRLLTKGRHSMSTRAPSPPAHSSLKVRSEPPSPAPSPSNRSLSDVFGNGVARVMGSGSSTPKRITFAEFPESYSSSRPGSSKLRESKNKKRNKKKGNEKDEEQAGGWLKTWMSLSAGVAGREERVEERMSRGWGSRPGFGTTDDWAV
ncbi:hypothetical protein BU15DRAFT_88227 [Melanogaster broomeanus]|nr:hypothetical protein BU15DRAFT_88227 [Melanogaster broomeanus]